MHRNGTPNGQPPLAPFRLEYDAWGRLVLIEAGGRQHVGVDPVRAFPISDPRNGISLCDAEGHEIRWIEHLDDEPEPARRLIEEELSRRELVPVVRRVVGISALVEPSAWEVETDRGPTRFILDSDEKVRRLGEHGALIQDASGIRYLIPDTRRLDPASRHLLERYL